MRLPDFTPVECSAFCLLWCGTAPPDQTLHRDTYLRLLNVVHGPILRAVPLRPGMSRHVWGYGVLGQVMTEELRCLEQTVSEGSRRTS